MRAPDNLKSLLTRRGFLLQSVATLGALGFSHRTAAAAHSHTSSSAPVRFGLFTDIHYADIPPAGTRHYRESLPKIREAIGVFNAIRPDFIIQLGDFIDAAEDAETELHHLRTVEAEYSRFRGPRHYVLGNHCVWTLSKQEFMEHTGARDPFYSFDRGGIHFVVLDACYRPDGVSYGRKNYRWNESDIPPHQREWLSADLKSTEFPVVVFVHQRLDIPPPYGILSHEVVRQELATSGKVLAVLQGHNHKNDHRIIDDIHYFTFQAVVENSGPSNNGYSIVDVNAEGVQIFGFRRHPDFPSPAPVPKDSSGRVKSSEQIQSPAV